MRFAILTSCGFLALLWRFSHGVRAGLQLGARVALGDECFQRHEVGTGHWHVAVLHGWHVEVAASFVHGAESDQSRNQYMISQLNSA